MITVEVGGKLGDFSDMVYANFSDRQPQVRNGKIDDDYARVHVTNVRIATSDSYSGKRKTLLTRM